MFGPLEAVSQGGEVMNPFKIFLEFQNLESHQLALESTYLGKTESGAWTLVGRVRNLSEENLHDTWVLSQIFDEDEGVLSFEEVPIPINPLPPREASPFKVMFEQGLPIRSISIAFKNASGKPIPTLDRRKVKEWVEGRVEMEGAKENISQPLPSSERQQTVSTESLNTASSAATCQPESIEQLSLAEPPPSDFFQAEGNIEDDEFREKEPAVFTQNFNPEGELLLTQSNEIEGPLPVRDDFTEMRIGIEEGGLRSETLSLEEEASDGERAEGAPEGVEEESSGNPAEPFDLPLASFSPIQIASEESEPGLSGTFESESDVPNGTETKQGFRFDLSLFEEASKLLEEISNEPMKKEDEEPLPFQWIEDFRNSVESYHENNRDPFVTWFGTLRRANDFDEPDHLVATILAHARFCQKGGSEEAFQNTLRVFKLLRQKNVRREEVPGLEGTPFMKGDLWTELFHKAIPKLREVANRILTKRRWNASDLQRLVQIIPFMGERNSERAVRWICELIPDLVEVEASTISFAVNEGLYRVAARLGIVDPFFDTYQGKHSLAHLKIKAFARMAFPLHPWKVEGPMTWCGIGISEGGGGYCLPSHPVCEGCLFGGFCPRLYLDFNPSERGMKAKEGASLDR